METLQHTNSSRSIPEWLSGKANISADGVLIVHVESPWKKGKHNLIQVPVGHTLQMDPMKGSWAVYSPFSLFPVYTLSRTGLSIL